jgi:hypothetical protein
VGVLIRLDVRTEKAVSKKMALFSVAMIELRHANVKENDTGSGNYIDR